MRKENPMECHPERGRTPESKDPGARRCTTSVMSFTAISLKTYSKLQADAFSGPSARAFALAQDDNYIFFAIWSTLTIRMLK
jgi:hypothetical protein